MSKNNERKAIPINVYTKVFGIIPCLKSYAKITIKREEIMMLNMIPEIEV
jgi:hypothetical protein